MQEKLVSQREQWKEWAQGRHDALKVRGKGDKNVASAFIFCASQYALE